MVYEKPIYYCFYLLFFNYPIWPFFSLIYFRMQIFIYLDYLNLRVDRCNRTLKMRFFEYIFSTPISKMHKKSAQSPLCTFKNMTEYDQLVNVRKNRSIQPQRYRLIARLLDLYRPIHSQQQFQIQYLQSVYLSPNVLQ